MDTREHRRAIVQKVSDALDQGGADWNDEFNIALLLIDSAIERAPPAARAFLLERLARQEVPTIAQWFDVPLRGRFVMDPPTVAAN
jgi:hypothetical protein